MKKGVIREDHAFFIGSVNARGTSRTAAPHRACERAKIHEHGRRGSRQPGKKKGQPKSPQNALRAHQIRKDWFLLLALVRVFPDKKSKPCKKQHHETDGQDSGEHHVIEKHDWPPGPCSAAMELS
jgi:hypothetical protein